MPDVECSFMIIGNLLLITFNLLSRNPHNEEQMYHTYLGPIPDLHASRRNSFTSQTQRISKYYSSNQRPRMPWQSTRPLPDPETDCVVEYINDHDTIKQSHGRRYEDRERGGATYDILDPAFGENEHGIFAGD